MLAAFVVASVGACPLAGSATSFDAFIEATQCQLAAMRLNLNALQSSKAATKHAAKLHSLLGSSGVLLPEQAEHQRSEHIRLEQASVGTNPRSQAATKLHATKPHSLLGTSHVLLPLLPEQGSGDIWGDLGSGSGDTWGDLGSGDAPPSPSLSTVPPLPPHPHPHPQPLSRPHSHPPQAPSPGEMGLGSVDAPSPPRSAPPHSPPPHFQPPSPPPPSPSTPPPPTPSTPRVEILFTIQGNEDSFNQTSFKIALAAELGNGVQPSNITLTFGPASSLSGERLRLFLRHLRRRARRRGGHAVMAEDIAEGNLIVEASVAVVSEAQELAVMSELASESVSDLSSSLGVVVVSTKEVQAVSGGSVPVGGPAPPASDESPARIDVGITPFILAGASVALCASMCLVPYICVYPPKR